MLNFFFQFSRDWVWRLRSVDAWWCTATTSLALSSKRTPQLRAGKASGEGNMPLDKELHKAAYKGDRQTVHELLQVGEDVNARGAQNRTALHRAVSKGDDAIIKLLLDASADVSLLDSGGLQAVHWSAMFGHVACARLLTAAKADLMEPVKTTGEGCLHLAAEKDRVTYLLENNADPSKTNMQGKTPLDLATAAKASEVIKLLPKQGGGGGCCVVM